MHIMQKRSLFVPLNDVCIHLVEISACIKCKYLRIPGILLGIPDKINTKAQ